MSNNLLIIKSDAKGICELPKNLTINTKIKKGQVICTCIEYFLRHDIISPVNGTIKEIYVQSNDFLNQNDNIMTILANEESENEIPDLLQEEFLYENIKNNINANNDKFINKTQNKDLLKNYKIRRNKQKRRDIILNCIGLIILFFILALVSVGINIEFLAVAFILLIPIAGIRCLWNILLSVGDFLLNGTIQEVEANIRLFEAEEQQKEDEKKIKLQILTCLKHYVSQKYKNSIIGDKQEINNILITRDWLLSIIEKVNTKKYSILKNYKNEFIEELNQKKTEQDELFFSELLDLGCIEFKEYLLKFNYGDIKTIDNYTKTLEELAQKQKTNLKKNQQSEGIQITEEDIYKLNIFYENQNKELTNILKQGIKKISSLKEWTKMNDNIQAQIQAILENSLYPSFNNKIFEYEYKPENKVLIINYLLPLIDSIDKIKRIDYQKSKNLFKEYYLSNKELQVIYDNLLYEITLRSIYEIFSCIKEVDTIAFNGIIDYIDKANGKNKKACILSVQTTRKEFDDINLLKVIPIDCFRKLKGISSKTLCSITPIKPILQLNKNDKRFIEAYEVIDNIEESYNLATMDWQDFENLIREIFEKSFSENGGEVRVTQSSRDGGVDAIAFDPDPIRGGKIVIQAKRYTNIVGVSAVRDLYGTVINEGAIKGILVTTADFGSDSYEFAKDKPITLLNGNNLLHLLEQYGYKARINLKEAKEYFKTVDRK